MNRRSKKKVVAAVLGVLLALSAVTAAVAYFTGASGNATGTGAVGTSSPWTVAMQAPTWSGTLSALYPGATNDTEYLPFTATNNGNGHQAVTTVTVTMPTEANGDAETSAGADITGCKAAWFTAVADSGNPALPSDIAPGSAYSGKVDLTMQNLTTTVQDACKSASPAVNVAVS
jgi:hypothetical protein